MDSRRSSPSAAPGRTPPTQTGSGRHWSRHPANSSPAPQHESASHMTRATSAAAHQLARRHRLLIAITLLWLWWALAPPTDAIELAVGLTAVLVTLRMLAPESTTPTRSTRSRKRRAL